MTKRRRQTNGNQGTVQKPADVAANAASTSDSGEPVSDANTAAEVAGELVAVDGVNKSDKGNMSDGTEERQDGERDNGGETAKAEGTAATEAVQRLPAGAGHHGDVETGSGAGSSDEGSTAGTGDGSTQEAEGSGEEVDVGDDIEPTCFICAGGFEPSDLCAADIEEGTCHAECLEGSPTVSLTTGDPTDGPMHTFVYVEEMIDSMRASAELQAALQSPIGKDLRSVFDLAAIGAGLQQEIRKLTSQEGPFKDWVPELSPIEIVGDMNAALAHARESVSSDAPPRLPNFASDVDPREVVASYAYGVLCGVYGATDDARMILEDDHRAVSLSVTSAAATELVELVRKIGDHATPEVMAHQLVIGKHRQSPELTMPEKIALKAFACVLRDLDACADGVKARREAEAAETPTAKRVPIEETNLEPADGPLDTWR